MRKPLTSLLAVLFAASAPAMAGSPQERPAADSLGVSQSSIVLDSLRLSVDSTYIERFKKLNDYSMIGIQGGVALSQTSFQPTMNQESFLSPINFGIMYTRYGKLFGYMPYFGFQAGIFYTQEGYSFKENEETHYTPTLFGATQARMRTIEFPFMAHLHVDFWKMKLMANLGIYGGYRLNIERIGDGVSDEYRNDFNEYEYRWDYGIKAGGGLGLMLDPLEIHIMCWYKYSWSNLYAPDYRSKYYYYWAYPTNLIFSVGIHWQLSRRNGRTTAELKAAGYEEAKRAIEEAKKALEEADSIKEQNDTTSVQHRDLDYRPLQEDSGADDVRHAHI